MYFCWLLKCVKRVPSTGATTKRTTKRIPQCTCLLRKNFSDYHALASPKRNSPYSSVDTGRYSSLVESVVNKVSAQTPHTLEEQDEYMYGPSVKAQPPRSEPRVPKINHPFLNCHRTYPAREPDPGGPPTHIMLARGKDRSSVPSVSRILQKTLSPEQMFYLERWKRRMIAELGEEGFKDYSQNLFRQGALFHTAVEDMLTPGAALKQRDPADSSERPPEVEGYLESVAHVLEDVSAVRAIESTVQHDTLNYLGIVDCVARYRGVLCVIDWKTSEKPKPHISNTYDNPLQVAAYAGALNKDDNYKYQVDSGLIVVAYKDGSPAHAHPLSSDKMGQYWQRWLLRLEQFVEKR